MLLSERNTWSMIPEAMNTTDLGHVSFHLHQMLPPCIKKFVGSCISRWYFILYSSNRSSHNAGSLSFTSCIKKKKHVMQHLTAAIWWSCLYKCHFKYDLDLGRMLSYINTHTKDGKRYAPLMMNRTQHCLQPCTFLVRRNSSGILLNSPWLDHVAALWGVLDTKVIVFSEAYSK